jgi:putative endonuclease
MWDKLIRFGRAGSSTHLTLGSEGERLAARFLESQGYRLVLTNFLAPIGLNRNGRQVTGEIDLIAYDESAIPFELTFIEVKTRSNDQIATPESAVDRRKRRRIVRTANVYRRLMSVEHEPARYDVVSVLLKPNAEPELRLWRRYFSAPIL